MINKIDVLFSMDQQNHGVVYYRSTRSWCFLLSINNTLALLTINHNDRDVFYYWSQCRYDWFTRSWCCLLSINKILVLIIVDYQGRCIVYDWSTTSCSSLLVINKIVHFFTIDPLLCINKIMILLTIDQPDRGVLHYWLSRSLCFYGLPTRLWGS